MTIDDVRRIFARYVGGDDLILSATNFVPIDSFVILFDSASSNSTYQELVDIDGGDKGYIPFFNKCKTDGILT